MRERPNLAVGSLVIARRTTGVCDVGERGVCYEEYTLPDGKDGRRGGKGQSEDRASRPRYRSPSPSNARASREPCSTRTMTTSRSV